MRYVMGDTYVAARFDLKRQTKEGVSEGYYLVPSLPGLLEVIASS
jgi:hypothetical protein